MLTWHESIPVSLAGKAFAPMSCPYAWSPTDFAWMVTSAICRSFGWLPPDDKVPHPDMMAFKEMKVETFHLFIHPKSLSYPWDLPWNQLEDFVLASMLALCLLGLAGWNHLPPPWATRKSHCLELCLLYGNLGVQLFCKAAPCML